MLIRFALVTFSLVVATTTFAASQAEQFRTIVKFYNIAAPETLASAQQANLNSNFSKNFTTLNDFNKEKVITFGSNHPDRIVAFRDYLQLLTKKGYMNADQALILLEFATRSAVDTGLPVIRQPNRKDPLTPTIAKISYDAKLPPPSIDVSEVTLPKEQDQSPATNRNDRHRTPSKPSLESKTYSNLAVIGESTKIYTNGRHDVSTARIHAMLALTKQTQPFYLDGVLGLSTGKLASSYSSRKQDLRSAQALVGAGLYSGDYNPTDFIGLQTSLGISSEWYSGSVDGSSASGRDTYVSLGIIGGNGNTAVEYQVGTPTTDFIDSGYHAINLYFPYEKKNNSSTYFGVGILYRVSPGQESVGLVFRSGILSNAK